MELRPGAAEPLRLAALTHDMERHFPGGPRADPAKPPWDRAYRDAHAQRSARIVGEWLAEQDAPDALVAEAAELIRLHEWGGTPDADALQAADSLSFLEVNGALLAGWVRDGRVTAERARAQLTWMARRPRPDRARALAQPLLREALDLVDASAAPERR